MTARFEWYGGQVIDSVEKAKKVGLTHACVVVQGDAKSLSPVDTGNLRNSITYKVSADDGKVGTNVHYAIHQEYGTKKMSAQPFLRPALDRNRETIKRVIGEFIGAAAERGGKK